jgi:hypothetical protein
VKWLPLKFLVPDLAVFSRVECLWHTEGEGGRGEREVGRGGRGRKRRGGKSWWREGRGRERKKEILKGGMERRELDWSVPLTPPTYIGHILNSCR